VAWALKKDLGKSDVKLYPTGLGVAQQASDEQPLEENKGGFYGDDFLKSVIVGIFFCFVSFYHFK